MWYLFPSLMWHCWLGDRKDIRPVKSWMLVCCWWQFDWSFAHVAGAVVSATPTPVNSSMETLWCQITRLVLEWLLNELVQLSPHSNPGKLQHGDTLVSANPACPGMAVKWVTLLLWRFQIRLFGDLKQHCRQCDVWAGVSTWLTMCVVLWCLGAGGTSGYVGGR